MKLKKPSFCALLLLFTLLYSPAFTHAEEIMSEVLIVIKTDEILAFSSLKNNWVSESLRQNERILNKGSKGNIAIVATNLRLFGFSAFTNKWEKESLSFNESIEEIQIDGNVATSVTSSRVFGFKERNWGRP